MTATSQDHGISGTAEWVSIRETTARLRTPSLATNLGRLASSILPLGALYALMYACLPLGWAAPLALSLVAAGFVVRGRTHRPKACAVSKASTMCR